jgi:hypothetical protein
VGPRAGLDIAVEEREDSCLEFLMLLLIIFVMRTNMDWHLCVFEPSLKEVCKINAGVVSDRPHVSSP